MQSTPSFAFTAALLALLLLTACESTTVTLTAAPPSGSPSALAARQIVYVANTDRLGTDLRQAPGPAGAQIRQVPEGAVFEATGRQQQIEHRIWGEVRDSTGIVGWMLVEYLSVTPPAGATSTAIPALGAPLPTPSSLPFLEPSSTPTPGLGPRPTVTLVPTLPPAPPPVLVPLPPDATARPATSTLPPIAPAAPTSDRINPNATPTRPAVTAAPTLAPTRVPTLEPTRVPTGR